MVDEAGRPAHVLPVDDVDLLFGILALFGELVERVQVRVLVGARGGFAPVGFFVRDDFAAVGVDELACF